MINCLQSLCKTSNPCTFLGHHHHHNHNNLQTRKNLRDLNSWRSKRREFGVVCGFGFLPVDPWAPTTAIDSQNIASQLFAASLFPYIGFLYFLTNSKTAPKLTLFGFYFLLAFVGATMITQENVEMQQTLDFGIAVVGSKVNDEIVLKTEVVRSWADMLDLDTLVVPAGIYAKVHYGTSLSNVDWLHGGAESLLTITNLFIVIGLRQALRKAKDANVSTTNTVLEVKDDKKSSL
ncbi:hypothetical protein GIB67_006390 [Kingdonia uniflora]|uniref:Uncharacterized protein n=1 Tax=Kingdonia uniflora TaxID=39325 RepID=A0A7J7P1E5_9MAGN|nr:hypothetical protein GIB67_006390 [Kingdonia uniflora]